MPADTVVFILQALEALPSLVAAGADAYGYVVTTSAATKLMAAQNRGPTDAEWAALDDSIAALTAQLDS